MTDPAPDDEPTPCPGPGPGPEPERYGGTLGAVVHVSSLVSHDVEKM